MLDNNNLINLKAKLGVSAPGKHATTLYLKSRLLEREMKVKLSKMFDHSIDLEIFVDKILEKISTVEVCEVVRNYHTQLAEKQFIAEASKIKSFMIKMKKIAGEVDKALDEDEDAFYRCEDDDDKVEDLEDLL